MLQNAYFLAKIGADFARKYAFDSIFQALQDLHPFAPLQSQNFRKKIGLKKQQFSWNFSKKIENVAKFHKFCQISKISAWESGRFWKMLQNAYFLAKIGADTAENEQHFAEILPIGRCVADRRRYGFRSPSSRSSPKWPFWCDACMSITTYIFSDSELERILF